MTHHVPGTTSRDSCPAGEQCWPGPVKLTSWGQVQRFESSEVQMEGRLSDPPRHAQNRDLMVNDCDLWGLGAGVLAITVGALAGLLTTVEIGGLLFVSLFVAALITMMVTSLVTRPKSALVTVVKPHPDSGLSKLLHGCLHESVRPVAEIAAEGLIRRDLPEPDGFSDLATALLMTWKLSGGLAHERRDDVRSTLRLFAQDLPATAETVIAVRSSLQELTSVLCQRSCRTFRF